MARSNIITAIDIGTSAVKAMQIRSYSDGREPDLLGIVKEPSFGVRKGVVFDHQKVADVVKKALDDLFNITQQKIGGVFVNVGGSHLFLTSSQGGVAVSRADQRISQEDLDRVLAAAEALFLPPNKEILNYWPKHYIVDRERGIKEPLGMRGTRLEVEILAVCGFSPYIKNVTEAVLDAGYEIYERVPSPVAAARSILMPRQRELGCAVLDIGARTTDLSIFEEGELVHAAVFPVGSANITDDIAIGLKIDLDSAEKIKTDYGRFPKKIGAKEIIKTGAKNRDNKKAGAVLSGAGGKKNNRTIDAEVTPGSVVSFSSRMLDGIIEARLSDIFDEVNRELKKISRQELLPAGVVLTGGGAQMSHIVDVAKKELRLPCSIGFPQGIRGITDVRVAAEERSIAEDPAWTAVCGLALGGSESAGVKQRAFTTFGVGAKFKSWFKMFIP